MRSGSAIESGAVAASLVPLGGDSKAAGACEGAKPYTDIDKFSESAGKCGEPSAKIEHMQWPLKRAKASRVSWMVQR